MWSYTREVEPVRFGIFELDPASGELRRNGSVVRLAPQPGQVLRLLVERQGELVSRDDIRREVWGETAVDFDRSLNVCIAQIRSALNDDADSPRFIQTIPRRGYRFLAPVERPAGPEPPLPRPRGRILLLAAIATAVIALSAAAYRLTRAPDPILRMAVLPFEAAGLDDRSAAQIDGIFDQLLTRLSGIQPERLRVIGRRSVTRVDAEHRGLKSIGQRLDVRYVTEGSARLEGSHLRITMRLVQTGDESVLWADTFTQEGEPGAFEADVVARVSAAVLSRLFPGAAPAATGAGCREGWEPYLSGRVLASGGTLSGLERSLSFFEQAPCAASRAALAEALVRLARISSRYNENWERARAAASQALQLDPQSAGAHLALGNVAFWHDWNWTAAEREFQAALRLNPSNPDAHHDLAWLQLSAGRRDQGVASLQQALALDPLSARIHMDSAWLLLQAGRYREAAGEARGTLEVDPEMKEAYSCLSRALLFAGDLKGFVAALRPLLEEPVRREADRLPQDRAARYLVEWGLRSQDPYQRAWRLVWLGRSEEALSQLEEAFRSRSPHMPLVPTDPGLASLRAHPRFQKIVRDLGR